MELDRRKQALLGTIVDTYVARAEPVGSEWLAAAGNLGVRSATIRNEMADLTELGYLRQPHTSAGRVPSTLGYRYYVDHLMQWARLSPATTRILRDLQRLTEGDVEQLLVQTCRLLSSLTGYTSVASAPSADEVGVRSAHLVQMGASQVLMVAVLENGRVVHRFADLGRTLLPAEVTRLSNGLDALVRGARPNSTPAAVPHELAKDAETLHTLARALLRGISEEAGGAYLEGASHMLEQPEFRDADRVEPLIRLLEERRSLYEKLRELLATRQLAVVIGEENPHALLQECSVVMARYQAGERMAGWVAVLGPTRMRYEKAAPAVHFTARALSEALTRIGLA